MRNEAQAGRIEHLRFGTVRSFRTVDDDGPPLPPSPRQVALGLGLLLRHPRRAWKDLTDPRHFAVLPQVLRPEVDAWRDGRVTTEDLLRFVEGLRDGAVLGFPRMRPEAAERAVLVALEELRAAVPTDVLVNEAVAGFEQACEAASRH